MRVDLSDRNRLRIGVTFGSVAVGLSVASMATLFVLGDWGFLVEISGLVFGVVGAGFGVLTIVMIRSQPRNGAVWAIAWAGVFASLYVAGAAGALLLTGDAFPGLTYEVFRELSPAQLPRPAAFAIHLRFWSVYPAIWLPLTLGLLLFPDGHPQSPRWKWVGWWSVLAITLGATAAALSGNPWSTLPIRFSESTVPGTLGALMTAGFLLAALSAIVSLGSLVVRYRHSSGVARSQIRWIALGGAFLVAFIFVVPYFETEGPSSIGEELVGVVAMMLLMASYGVAITKYRLYDIDVIISKSVTYVGLAAVITLLYVAVVVAPLLVLGQADDGGPGLLLPILATAVVAVLFEPIRSRLQRWANRLVYGDRATPHEVLSQVTSNLSEAAVGNGSDDLARLVAAGTGAEQAIVWLHSGGLLQPEGIWQSWGDPAPIEPLAIGALAKDELGDVSPVRHGPEVIGALSIRKPRNDPVTPADRELLSDAAAGAGLLLRNIRLNRELEERAREVTESRRRLIAAQDAERRRLERDLHDGAQQQVVALKVKLGIARTIAEREGADEIVARVDALAEGTQEAVDALRAVAHGIYPPLLESEGLEPALRAAERTSSIPLVIELSGLSRYERPIEQTVYFCVLETVERARMAGAAGMHVGVAANNLDLIVEVDMDQSATAVDLIAVSDRIDAAGGNITIEDRADKRTRITSSIPISTPALGVVA